MSPSRLSGIGHRLYTGEIQYDFVGKAKRWYLISLAILVVSAGALVVRGLNYGIEFRGGAEFRVENAQCSIEEARAAAEGIYPGEAIVQELQGNQIRVQTGPLQADESGRVLAALADACDVSENQINSQIIGPTWGGEITRKALTGLVVFIVLVVLYLSLAFEWKMALAAIVALAHDLLITVGIYALVGFDVTPATVIGLLTILGYSLYDTVVVFDKVRENTAGIRGGSRMTYSEAANLAVNQTLVRSINTSVIALLPVAAILFVGAGLLGAGTLKDLALALFVGIAAGTYSSIFIATPLLAQLKEREPDMQALARRVRARKSTQPSQPGPAAGARGGLARPGKPARAGAEAGNGGPPALPAADAPPARDEAPPEAAAGAASARQQPRRNQPSRRPSNRPSGKKRRR
jgi:preprotein translocase subunit SecF